jgi:hypothetical protein
MSQHLGVKKETLFLLLLAYLYLRRQYSILDKTASTFTLRFVTLQHAGLSPGCCPVSSPGRSTIVLELQRHRVILLAERRDDSL